MGKFEISSRIWKRAEEAKKGLHGWCTRTGNVSGGNRRVKLLVIELFVNVLNGFGDVQHDFVVENEGRFFNGIRF